MISQSAEKSSPIVVVVLKEKRPNNFLLQLQKYENCVPFVDFMTVN